MTCHLAWLLHTVRHGLLCTIFVLTVFATDAAWAVGPASSSYDTVWDRVRKIDWGAYLAISGKRMPVQHEQIYMPGGTLGVTMNQWLWLGGILPPV